MLVTGGHNCSTVSSRGMALMKIDLVEAPLADLLREFVGHNGAGSTIRWRIICRSRRSEEGEVRRLEVSCRRIGVMFPSNGTSCLVPVVDSHALPPMSTSNMLVVQICFLPFIILPT